MDVTESIRKVASKTPSEDFKDLLWGLNTTINAGGSIQNYLHEKAKGYMDDYKRRLDQYSDTLSTLLEVYLTLIIVGSMFFIAMSTMMSMFGIGQGMQGIILVAQALVIFIFLPVVSMGFIYLLKSISPRGGQ
ncbi:MAG: type II secretion system F family protein, partial [Candidatus Aenigmatarchaeota archaeon]